MGKIVKTTDFIGKYAITQNQFNTTQLQSFIDKYELLYLYDLLGVTLGNLFYNDIAPLTFLAPVTAKYATLFNAIYSDSTTLCGQIRSEGVKEMLKGFIYWEFVKAQKAKNTITGNVVGQNEVSREADWNETEIYNNYNQAVMSYRSIQRYIVENHTDYTEYKGLIKQYNNWFI